MSGIIEVQTPDGQLVQIEGAPDEDSARQRAYQWWQQTSPEAAQEWRRNLPQGGFGQNFVEAARGSSGAMVGGIGTVSDATGLPGAQGWRDAGEYIAGTSATAIPTTRGFENFSDLVAQFRQSPWATTRAAVGQGLGSVVGSVAAPVAAGGLAVMGGASLPVAAALGLGAAIASGALSSANELEQMLISEGVPREQSAQLAASVGSLIGAGEGGAAGAMLTRLLGRQIRRETAEQLVRMAARSGTRSAAREGAIGIGIEGGSEMAGSALREGTVAAATGNINFGERLDRVLLDGVLGSLGGGAAGGLAGTRQPGQAAAQLQARNLNPDGTPIAVTPPTTAPEAPPIENPLPPEPAAITTPEEAAAFFTSERGRAYRPGFETTPEQAVTLAQAHSRRVWLDDVAQRRTHEINTFMGMPDIARFAETDEQGRPRQREVRDQQAATLMQSLVRAATDPANGFNIGNFSVQEVANIALRGLGPEVDGPTPQELGIVRSQLNALRQAGFLQRGEERGTYAIAPRDVEGIMARKAFVDEKRRQKEASEKIGVRRGDITQDATYQVGDEVVQRFPNLAAKATEADETPQQEAARRVRDYLGTGDYVLANSKDLMEMADYVAGKRDGMKADRQAQFAKVFGTRPDNAVGDLMRKIAATRDLLAEINAVAAENPRLDLGRPDGSLEKLMEVLGIPIVSPENWPTEIGDRHKILDELGRAFRQESASYIDVLNGYVQPAAKAAHDTTPTMTTPRQQDTSTSLPAEDPMTVLKAINAATDAQRLAQMQQVFSDDAKARQILEAMTRNLRPKEVMSWNKWQAKLREAGVPFTQDSGRFMYETAKRTGIIKGNGQLAWRAEDGYTPPAPAPQPPPPQAPKPPAPKPPPPKPPAPKAPPTPAPKAPAPQAPKPPQAPAAPQPPTTPQSPQDANRSTAAEQAAQKAYPDAKDGVEREAFKRGFFKGALGPNSKLQDLPTKPTPEQRRLYVIMERGYDTGLGWHNQHLAGKAKAQKAPKLAAHGPWGEGESIVVTPGVTPDVAGFVQELLGVLGMTQTRIFVTNKQDVLNPQAHVKDRLGIYERWHTPFYERANKKSSYGLSMRTRDGKLGMIMYDASRSLPVQLETIAHEIGHIFQSYAFENADKPTQRAVVAAFEAWHARNKDLSARDYMWNLRTPAVAGSILDEGGNKYDTITGAQLSEYERSFAEWFADQVARWSITHEVPRTLVDRFFHAIAQGYRQILDSLGIRAMPEQSVADFIQKFREQNIATEPNATKSALDATVISELTAPTLPTDIAKAHKLVKQTMDQQIKGFLKWFGSPVMTMGKVKPALQPASETMRTLYNRTQQATEELERLLVPATRLSPESRAKITRLADQANRTRKAPDTSGLTAEEKAGLQAVFATGQRALDFFVEASAMKHFLPSEDKSAAAQQRLQAFWDKHGEKHLWEIPLKEVAAASPEGFREMQKLERLRNPYYLPQMARGTHFVAAYQRMPGGQEKLVRMVAYDPLNVMQKFRGFADPEAAAVLELRKEFPSDKTHRIMTRGIAFKNDADAAKKRDSANFIAEWFSKLNEVSNKRGQAVIQQMMAELDKAQLERIFRPNQDILRAVTPWNEQSYVMDALPQFALSMAKIQARKYTQDMWTKSLANLHPNDKAFLNDLRDYATTPTEAFGAARSLAFFTYLGGAIDTAMVNITQLPQVAWPMLVRDVGLAAATKEMLGAAPNVWNRNFVTALTDSVAFSENVAKTLSPVEAEAFKRAMKDGVFNPIFTNESRGQFTAELMGKAGFKDGAAAAKRANGIAAFAGSLMQGVEAANRATTFLAAYRLATKNPDAIVRANKVDNTNYKDAYAYAMGKVFDTQFLTTKEDRAYIQRFTPAAEVATQFMSFPLKMIEQYVRHGSMMLGGIYKHDPFLAKAGAVGLFGMVVPLVALAGIWALPGAELLRELLEKLAGKLWGSTQNFDIDARRYLGGGWMAESVVRGIPHAIGAVGLQARMKIDPFPIEELSTMSLVGMAGPVGGIAEAWLSRFPQYLRNGDYWNAAAVLMPRAMGNVVRGIGLEATGEQRTLRGNRVITPEEMRSYNERTFVPASVRQAVGFPPPEFMNFREAVTRAEEINRQVREPTETANKELAGYLTRYFDAQQRGDDRAMARQMESFQRRTVEIMRQQEGRPPEQRINLSMEGIRTRAINDFLGIGSPEVTTRRAPRQMRPEVERDVRLLLWRNQGQTNFAKGGLVRGFTGGGEVAGEEPGTLLRQPYDSELRYFESNPHVAGMATEDDRVILNPYSRNSPEEQQAVLQNETARVLMRTGRVDPPDFDLTPEQERRFGTINGGRAYGSAEDIRATVAARILSSDPSAGNPTPEQQAYVARLRAAMQGRVPQ